MYVCMYVCMLLQELMRTNETERSDMDFAQQNETFYLVLGKAYVQKNLLRNW